MMGANRRTGGRSAPRVLLDSSPRASVSGREDEALVSDRMGGRDEGIWAEVLEEVADEDAWRATVARGGGGGGVSQPWRRGAIWSRDLGWFSSSKDARPQRRSEREGVCLSPQLPCHPPPWAPDERIATRPVCVRSSAHLAHPPTPGPTRTPLE